MDKDLYTVNKYAIRIGLKNEQGVTIEMCNNVDMTQNSSMLEDWYFDKYCCFILKKNKIKQEYQYFEKNGAGEKDKNDLQQKI